MVGLLAGKAHQKILRRFDDSGADPVIAGVLGWIYFIGSSLTVIFVLQLT